MQQIKKFLAQRGGVDGEANSDELAIGVMYLMSVFHGAHPLSSMSLWNSSEYRTASMLCSQVTFLIWGVCS